MSMIFPGMDPYLEDPSLWPGVHGRFIVHLADALSAKVLPRYVATIEERVYLEGADRSVRPDFVVRQAGPEAPAPVFPEVAEGGADAAVLLRDAPELIHERLVNILDLQAGRRVVAVIEVVSPSNKRKGAGRESYRLKQRDVLASDAHLMEIDLLRAGRHVLAFRKERIPPGRRYDSMTCVNRARDSRDLFELYPRLLPERLPRVRVPLADGDPDVVLDIQGVLDRTYETGHYRKIIDYTQPCVPPLRGHNFVWARNLIDQALSKDKPS